MIRRRPRHPFEAFVHSQAVQPLRTGLKPDCHSRFQAFGRREGVEAQPEAVEIMVADGARRPPRCEFTERPKPRDASA